tara:strand:- start:720 stop:848 length:129 start_codon:yes stop_codon:yes gene_type:complete
MSAPPPFGAIFVYKVVTFLCKIIKWLSKQLRNILRHIKKERA